MIRGGITFPVGGYGYVSGMVPTLSSQPAAAPAGETGVTYRELGVPPALAPWVRCLWQLTVQGEGGPGWVVPDGFMDLLGERQLRRRFAAGVGYGPKTLARVLRFQRLLALLTDDRAGRPTLAEAAALAGYADQAHMTAECTRLAGRSPAAVRASR